MPRDERPRDPIRDIPLRPMLLISRPVVERERLPELPRLVAPEVRAEVPRREAARDPRDRREAGVVPALEVVEPLRVRLREPVRLELDDDRFALLAMAHLVDVEYVL
jgi:hypothetical protein